ncbi:MAG: MBOAT family protein [Lachnospiraceae bacterium]|nr:MBOAT family protein [Lachnospiraceae bacterium]
MAFNSFQFLLFFPIVVILYYLIPRKLKRIWLLIASYYFYMSWSAQYAILIAASTLITYFSGILLEKNEKVSVRKWIVAGSFISNLGILVFFKYFDFLLDNVNSVLSLFGAGQVSNPFSLILPVGISFYTFQALGYTMDVYRNEIKAEKNIISYALFVSFFPQLVAGPIERSKNLLSQIKEIPGKKKFDYNKFVSGFGLMCFGMFTKMVIADRLSVFVDGVYNGLYYVGFAETFMAAIAFSLQIYCDFGGYSMIAIGAANVMGFDLCENFYAPYFADSIANFWRRWHISLSSWFKDYLYIPLGGNRCSKPRKYFNLMVTFLVSGLWHGADWTYVLWGGIHGIYQIVGDLLKPVKEKANILFKTDKTASSYKFGRIIVTFTLTTLAWIPFRAANFSELVMYFKNMFTRPNFWAFFDDTLFEYGLSRQETTILMVALLVLLLVDLVKYNQNLTIGEYLLEQNTWFRWIALILLIAACLVFGQYGIDFDSTQFIYFQF